MLVEKLHEMNVYKTKWYTEAQSQVYTVFKKHAP